MTEEEMIAGLDPGVRRLVTWLRRRGFVTTDSGDGTADMQCAVGHPHVVWIADPWRMLDEARRLQRLLWSADIQAEIEATYNLKDDVAAIVLLGVTDDMPPVLP